MLRAFVRFVWIWPGLEGGLIDSVVEIYLIEYFVIVYGSRIHDIAKFLSSKGNAYESLRNVISRQLPRDLFGAVTSGTDKLGPSSFTFFLSEIDIGSYHYPCATHSLGARSFIRIENGRHGRRYRSSALKRHFHSHRD